MIAGALPGREVVAGARAGARLRRRRPPLHHPAGSRRAAPRRMTPSQDAVVTAALRDRLPSPPRRATRPPERPPLRLGLVQERWHPDPAEHEAALATGIGMAAAQGATDRLPAGADAVPVLRRHPRRPAGRRGGEPRSSAAARRSASRDVPRPSTAFTCTRRYTSAPTARTAQTGSATTRRWSWHPTAALHSRTRKLHIPVTAGYYEDRYFRPGPASARHLR